MAAGIDRPDQLIEFAVLGTLLAALRGLARQGVSARRT
jgi:hypothetical protein